MPMFKQTIRLVVIGSTLAAVVLTVGAATPATAAGDFGEHVGSCAQTIGFSADHNPGMHQGRQGWDPAHTC
jgi:hypothetical protein